MAAASVSQAGTGPAFPAAAEPPEARGLARDGVRLLVSRADTGEVAHTRFSDLAQWLDPGDLLVVNTSGTLNAAVPARTPGGEPFVVHLSTSLPGRLWVVEIRRPGRAGSLPCRDGRAGMAFTLAGEGSLTLLSPYPLVGSLQGSSRLWVAALQLAEPVVQYLERHGSPIRYSYVPDAWPGSAYQTIFATEPGSAEMPSAGRPFSHALVTDLVSRGIHIAPVLLHTGVSSLEDHEPPYEEYFRVPAQTAERVNAARRSGHRVVAVGTTVVRALESVTDDRGRAGSGESWTNLVITPERRLRAVDGLISGLHEPRATHLAILRQALAAAGCAEPSAHLDRAYDEARRAGYLWHEFGDSHLIIGGRRRHGPRG